MAGSPELSAQIAELARIVEEWTADLRTERLRREAAAAEDGIDRLEAAARRGRMSSLALAEIIREARR